MINGGNKIIKKHIRSKPRYMQVQLGVESSSCIRIRYLNSFQERANGLIILIEILYDSVSFIRLKYNTD
jgi:SPX domain protein involved in polyphosphate accumulation